MDSITIPEVIVEAPVEAAPKATKAKAPKLAANEKLLDSGSIYTAH